MDNGAGQGICSVMATHPARHDADVLIAGGGLVGQCLALGLAQGGLRAAILDPAPADAADARSYSLNVASVRMLGALGVWDEVADEAQPILDIRVSDGRRGRGASPLHLHFDHAEIEEGPMGHMVEDRHLRPALAAALRQAGVERRAVAVRGQSPGPSAIAVETDDGTLTAPLLVGADGRGGGTAGRAGIDRTVKRYGQTALVAMLGIERDHGGTAHQVFLPPGPLALLPMTGRRVSIVWTEAEAEAGRVAALPDDAFLDHLRPLVGDLYGALDLLGGRHAYPLSLVLADRFVASRVALLGDTAHGVHPLAGQGLNAGMKDAAALAEVAADAARRGEDIGGAAPLAAYQRWRRFDAASLAVATDGLNRLFSNDSGLLRGVRRLGLGAAAHLPALRRAMIREAAGLTGEVPRLMRGEDLAGP